MVDAGASGAAWSKEPSTESDQTKMKFLNSVIAQKIAAAHLFENGARPAPPASLV